ncbi:MULTISPECIES: penicillin-binding transpeptidase domain-containing protein [Paenibacillus]|uniref:Penicillin-binding protein 2B n=1 Tax=Paenibacillus pabuli TaxID=1472 RepID=A0A855Y9J5_9BACL|nr:MULTISPECIES: penicillin-binding transpeptidase domain-containing protein [Paenibacillus]PWW43075.1 penicillin-binding protein 2B [Paenibacillus pabuli]PXW08982.1 penicillin-binding protein 2B [Paenibacillus taichungensis]RAJ03360.1 penicillin-binding protein 2B [Paenibacillus pabuli]
MVKRIKMRTLLIGGCITLFFLVLITRIFFIQVVNGGIWQERAAGLVEREQTIKASRGTITDRNGNILATDAPAYTVSVNPKIINQLGIEDLVTDKLSSLLGKSESEMRALVTAKKKDGTFFQQREVRSEGYKINPDLAAKVEEFRKELKDDYKGQNAIVMTQESKRYYPEETLASHLLGYMSRDGKAVNGLEVSYDEQLTGTDGYLNYQNDAKGYKLPDSQDSYLPPQNGSNLKLTIDDTIQYYIEDAMKEAVAQYNPLSMTVIAADPNTMEILGMANWPTFNPNTYAETPDQKNFINHAIQSIYEPGSTFKIVTLAGAVEEKLFDPNATFESKRIYIGGYPISDNGHAYGRISYLEGVKRSSNIAFVNLGYNMLGGERLRHYIDQFGFGKKTGIDLPSESASPIKPLVYKSEIATAAYGHGLVQVTPIQQVAAISAIANGGKLMEPHLVKEIINPNDGTSEVIKPKVVRQVISKESSKLVSGYLEQVVADQTIGTGRNAYIEGYRVAGKTGTARKVVNGEYSKSKDVVSFIGFAPVNNPKIAMLIVIDQPDGSNIGGGTAAAPVFKKIVSQTLQYMGVPKDTVKTTDKKSKTTPVVQAKAPDLSGKTAKQARSQLLNAGIAYETLGQGENVIRQYPVAGAAMNPGQRIYLLTEESSKMKIPDLSGESLRDALEVLSLMKVGVTVKGEGYVVKQTEQVAGEQRTVELVLQTAKAAVTGIADEAPESSDPASGDETNSQGTADGSGNTKETGKTDTTNSPSNGTKSSDNTSDEASLP